MNYYLSLIFSFVILLTNNNLFSQTCESTGSPDPAYFNTALGNENNNYKVKIYFSLDYNLQGTNGYPRERLVLLKDVIRDAFTPYGIDFEFSCDVNEIFDNDLAQISWLYPERRI